MLNQTRVQITYDREEGDCIAIRELPFVIGVLGDFTGMPVEPLPRLRDRRFVHIFPENLDAVMGAMRPHLQFSVDNLLADEPDAGRIKVDLMFKSMEDFLPENVARQVAPTRDLLDLRQRIVDLRSRLNPERSEAIQDVLLDRGKLDAAARELAAKTLPEDGVVASLVDQFVRPTPMYREHATDVVRAFLMDYLDGQICMSKDTELMANARIAQIDHLISLQVRAILRHESFQRLEASWRGLDELVRQTRHSEELKIKVLNVNRKELLRDLQRAPEIDQSAIFSKVCREEVWTFDVEPFAVLLGDYDFGSHPEDVELLEYMSLTAAQAHAPFLAAANPSMFTLATFTELHRPRSLERIFDNIEFAKWKSFRQSEASRYVGLLLPRILLRPPYSNDRGLTGDFHFEEAVDGSDHTHYLWGNPIYAFGQCFARACNRYMWPAAHSGLELGQVQLPTHRFVSEEGDTQQKGPTELPIDERRELELAALGFIPLCQRKGSGSAVFYETPSCQRPVRCYDAEKDRAAWIATQLPLTLAASRFCHYILAMWRDRIGTCSDNEAETFFNLWIQRYVIGDAVAAMEVRAKCPLREASVRVERISEENIRIRLSIRPHFRVPCPSTPLEVAFSLPAAVWKTAAE